MVPRSADTLTKRSRWRCAATASFSPPVTCRNQSRVSNPAKSARTSTPTTASRRALFGSVMRFPSLADGAVSWRSPDPPGRGGVLASGRPSDQREHDRSDHRVVQRGDDDDPQAVEGEHPRLADDRPGGDEHQAAEEATDAAE